MERKGDSTNQNSGGTKNRRVTRGQDLLQRLAENKILSPSTKIDIARSQPEEQRATWFQLAEQLNRSEGALRKRYRRRIRSSDD